MNTPKADQPGKNNGEFPEEFRFLLALHMLIYSARIHQDNNRIIMTAVERFITRAHQFLHEDDEITLLASENRFYLQQEKLVPKSKIAGMVHAMLEFFSRRKLSGLQLLPAVVEAQPEAIASFARLIDQAVNHENPATWLQNALDDHGLSWVRPIAASDNESEMTADQPTVDIEARRQEDKPRESDLQAARELDVKRKALQIYGYTVHSLKEIAQKVCANRPAGIKKTLRMVHSMIDMVFDDRNIFLGLSTIRDYDDYTFTHSINVCILSICLGHRIGLSKKSMETLSLSALFHDLGKIDVPKEIINKPGSLDERELKEMKNHSLYSVRRIILLKTTPQKKTEILLPPFEHHLKYDLSGYPQTPRKKPISLHGRIIAIADVFDAITAPRVYRPYAISPDRALNIMITGAGTDFDPILLKYFINMIGIYPIGTLLILDNEELGLAARYSNAEDGRWELWVQLIQPAEYGKFTKGELINLGPPDPGLGRFNPGIKESYHPSLYGIQPAEYLL